MPELFVYRAVLERLRALPARPYEVGGWLLGWWAEDGGSVFVTQATPPGPRGTPFGIRISGHGHRERFETAWDVSGGHVTFLGDWHTHPGGPASASERDHAALGQLASSERFGTPRPLALIVALPRWPWVRGPEPELVVLVRDEQGQLETPALVVVDELPEAAGSLPVWRWPAARGR